nr:helix-turn-helix transcriptional regulator [Albimonas pacifica]
MDASFFKKLQRQMGVTNDDLARKIGRDRTVISRIYSGERKLKPEEVSAFASLLQIPIDLVLEKAGLHHPAAKAMAGRSAHPSSELEEYDWTGVRNSDEYFSLFGIAGAHRTAWIVKTEHMILGGYKPGDCLVSDRLKAETAKRGDDVLAEVLDIATGNASLVLRRFEPPIIFALSARPDFARPMVVDHERVVIKGVVACMWRGL